MDNKPKLLYVVGVCLYNNTSANMSHNAFVKGFIENGYDVDIIMADDSWGNRDEKLTRLNANYHTYRYYSFFDKVRMKFSNADANKTSNITSNDSDVNQKSNNKNVRLKDYIRSHIKSLYYRLFKADSRYGLEVTWLKKAMNFSDDSIYDLVVSNSCPEAAHKLVVELKKRNRIKFKRWVQIWEDPWYYDLYGGMSEEIKDEEHYLLREASEVFYVSPLTLMYQKQYFSDCADKMKCVPLPFFEYTEKSANEKIVKNSFGYFGDYYSVTRNLQPFYNALLKSGFKGYIYGDTDLDLSSTDNIEVSGRVTLDVLSKIQDKTEVLVHLCNLKGGQIPGKIYHYSATTKPILFILDGTEDEKKALYEFFNEYDRYYFCENDEEAILATMKKISSDSKKFDIVTAFSPKEVVKRIICDEENTIY